MSEREIEAITQCSWDDSHYVTYLSWRNTAMYQQEVKVGKD